MNLLLYTKLHAEIVGCFVILFVLLCCQIHEDDFEEEDSEVPHCLISVFYGMFGHLLCAKDMIQDCV